MDYINKILCGNDLEILPKLPAESVNCVTCSPPYWGLRDYGIEPVIWDGDKDCEHNFGEYDSKLLHENRQNLDGGTLGNPKYRKNLHGFGKAKAGFCSICGAFKGSLGLEPTFELYIKHLCDIFDEVKRVLRKDGTCWVNIGDSYGGTQGKNAGWPDSKTRAKVPQQLKPKQYAKSLLDIPYRFSIEMTNRGWIKRNTIIWHKPNCMPASADDRFTVDFEYLFFFTKNNKAIFWTNEKSLECVSKKPPGTKGVEGKDWRWGVNSKGKPKRISFWSGHDYWFEQQFEDIQESTKNDKRTINGYNNIRGRSWDKDPNSMFGKMGSMKVNPNGRNRRAVWTIPTQPFPEAHFAVYPEELIETPIKAGCPEFICKKCGKARVKILEPTEEYKKLLGKSWHPHKHDAERGMSETPDKKTSCTTEYKFRGYSDCGCNAGFESGIVLDPFMGAGTTALVALKQRKRFIGVEIKQEYIDMTNKRISKVQQEIF